jgi:membrane associated rhomboid family serine protease
LAGYDAKEHKRQQKGIQAQPDDLIEILSYLIPRGDHFVSSILIDISLLVFLAMILSGEHILSPSASELLPWGANHRPSVLQGEWWRLVTSIFVHGGIMHLLFNSYGFVIAAIFIEPIFTRRNYFMLYLLSGIGGSLASIYWHPNTVSVGASGAIFGLYGALLGLLFTSAFGKGEKKGVWLFIGPYVGLNLLFGMVGNIDNAAHIGGLLSGALIGVLLYKLDNKKTQKQALNVHAKIHKQFHFKGHPDLQTIPQDIYKVVISIAPTRKKPIKRQERFYDQGKPTKVINYTKKVVVYQKYDQAGNLIEERHSNFHKNPDKGSLEGYKRFEYEQNKLMKETLYWVVDKTEHLQYENFKTYVGDLLIQDHYHLGNEAYAIQQSYGEAGNLTKVVFGEDERIHTLKYNEEDYVVECIIFEPKQIYQKQVFSYQQGRLQKTTEYFYLALDTMYDAKEEDTKAILEYEYLYDATGLLTQETTTDVLNKQMLDRSIYEYLPNP